MRESDHHGEERPPDLLEIALGALFHPHGERDPPPVDGSGQHRTEQRRGAPTPGRLFTVALVVVILGIITVFASTVLHDAWGSELSPWTEGPLLTGPELSIQLRVLYHDVGAAHVGPLYETHVIHVSSGNIVAEGWVSTEIRLGPAGQFPIEWRGPRSCVIRIRTARDQPVSEVVISLR